MHKLPSAQEVFDIVVNHLFTQGRPARQDDGRGRYRMTSGFCCAVGVLIPDGMYKEEFEGASAYRLIDKLYALELADWREHNHLLSSLQRVHDNCLREPDETFNTTVLTRSLRAVAERFSLEYRR